MNASERFHTEWRDYRRGLRSFEPSEQAGFDALAASAARIPPEAEGLSFTACAFFSVLLRHEVDIARLREIVAQST